MCARMRKVRLLVLPGALLVKVSLSLGDTGSGSARLDEKKDTHQFKEEVSKLHKGVGLYST